MLYRALGYIFINVWKSIAAMQHSSCLCVSLKVRTELSQVIKLISVTKIITGFLNVCHTFHWLLIEQNNC